MRKSIIFIVALAYSGGVMAATQDVVDRASYVISFGRVLSGKVEVNLEKNDVVIRDGSNITHLPAAKVQKVSKYDPVTGTEQVFYSGNFGLNGRPYLFEALSDGMIPLLYREGLKFSQYDEQDFPPFFILKDDQIFSLGLSKKEIIEVFDNNFQNDMTRFIKENKIDLKKKEDLRDLFDHFNEINMVAFGE